MRQNCYKKNALPTNYSDNLKEESIAFYFNTRSGPFFCSYAAKYSESIVQNNETVILNQWASK